MRDRQFGFFCALSLLEQVQIRISMAAVGHPTENCSTPQKCVQFRVHYTAFVAAELMTYVAIECKSNQNRFVYH